ncbi:hypothetical protein BKA65DRAFT_194410 [Rhexocercosporidium sp. MPI-PUGE-AT-0058]|nr:hypothetical protein BKA65DRAFT_194410 [Rhexocercosporidium sp. MPI-PUGE-AT-0058]
MGLQVGHHISGQMGLSYRVNSVVSQAVLELSPSTSEGHRRKGLALSEIMNNILLRKRLHDQVWRKRVVRDTCSFSNLPKKATGNFNPYPPSCGLLSVKQFTSWELVWRLGMSESRMVQIESEVHSARMAIGKHSGKLLGSRKSLKLRSHLVGNYNDSLTRAGRSLLAEFEKLLRQLVVLANSNAELRVNLERSALENNGIVQQIVIQRLGQMERLNDPILAIRYAIRNRYMENSIYPKRNKGKVLIGNEAAHNGDALADAILYHPSIFNRRVDMPTYANIYGLHPRQVWDLSDCKQFLQLITWYGTVKRWHPHNFTSTSFAMTWPADFFEKYSKAQLQAVRADFTNWKMDALTKLLEAKYAVEAKVNRIKHQ